MYKELVKEILFYCYGFVAVFIKNKNDIFFMKTFISKKKVATTG